MGNERLDIRGIPFPLAPITLVVGHYGVGKTNFSLNLAFDAKAAGKEVTVIDLDVVNPYFRSSDYVEQLQAAGIQSISPVYARTNLDVPSLSGAIEPALNAANENNLVIIDAGGDDVGATSLGRYSDVIAHLPHVMLYVVNRYRNLTQSPEEAWQVLREIEAKTHIKADGLVNNSHLKQETTLDMIGESQDFAEQCAALMGLPLVATTVPETLFESLREKSQEGLCSEPKSSGVSSRADLQKLYLMQVYVRTPWEQ